MKTITIILLCAFFSCSIQIANAKEFLIPKGCDHDGVIAHGFYSPSPNFFEDIKTLDILLGADVGYMRSQHYNLYQIENESLQQYLTDRLINLFKQNNVPIAIKTNKKGDPDVIPFEKRASSSDARLQLVITYEPLNKDILAGSIKSEVIRISENSDRYSNYAIKPGPSPVIFMSKDEQSTKDSAKKALDKIACSVTESYLAVTP